MSGTAPVETRTIGHYRLQNRLGEGGMGVVYLAYDELLERMVALKLLNAKLADGNTRAQLLNEARAASALKHPSVCTIYEVGECEGEAYIAMEYVEGRPLSEMLAEGPLPEEAILRYGVQISDALAHAHEQGIIHCDLKASNVIVTAEGCAKLVDFGLSKRLCDQASGNESWQVLAESGVVQGTLSYLAPEILRGTPAEARGDIWALGVLLFELATGQMPFQGHTGFELASSILRDAVPPLPLRMSAGLRSSIQRCLEKEPERRYKHASEVRSALEAVQSDMAARRKRVPRPTKWWPWAAVAALVLAAIVVIQLYRINNRPIDSVAVLPLMNANPDTEYLSDGITESLINNLSQLPRLKVMSRSSVYHFKNTKDMDVREAGRELGVRAVLTGRMVQRGDMISLSIELVDTRDNRELWGGRYERSLAKMPALQEEISQEVSENLRYWMSGEERKALTRQYPANSEAYQLYLQGRYHWNKRTPQELFKGVDYFRQSIDKDPNYALAYAGLADCYLSLGSAPFGPLAPQQAMPQAKNAALKALELDGTIAEAHTSLAYLHLVYDLDLPAADREFKRAIELNPSYALAHQWRGLYFTAVGRTDMAIQEVTRARELDPLNPVVYTALAQAYCFDGQNDACIAQAQKALELDPNFALAHFNVGRGFAQKKMYDQAVAEFLEGGPVVQQSPGILAALGYTYAVSGKRKEAEQKLAQLQALSRQIYVSALYIAAVYSGLGDKDQAFAYLEKAYEERSEYLVFLNMDPVINELRSDPRYDAFLKRVGIRKDVVAK